MAGACLDVAVPVDQEILGLEVSVHDLVVVAVLDPTENLKEQCAGLVFSHAPSVGQKVEKIAAGAVVEDHVDFFLRLDAFVEPAYVRMSILPRR